MRITAIASLASIAATIANAGEWQTYHNGRFGAMAAFPSGWRMDEAPVNGDGRNPTSMEGRRPS